MEQTARWRSVNGLDLGELIPGHHVVIKELNLGRILPVSQWDREVERLAEEQRRERGPGSLIMRRTATDEDRTIVGWRRLEPALHYAFVPGIGAREEVRHQRHMFWYWMLNVRDDVGTLYRQDNGGTVAPFVGGRATDATRDIGGFIPAEATELVMTFRPPSDWMPPEPWTRTITIDLTS